MPSTAPLSDDAEAIARAQRGDREAMHRLYATTVEPVTRFVSRRVPRQHVDDVVSETYARALAGLGNYRDRGIPVRAWLMRIAWNLIVDGHRGAAGRAIPVADVERPLEQAADPSAEWIERHDARIRLRTAFAALAPAQQAAIGLRHLEGFSVAEVATVLEINEAAVRALTYRGLGALRRALAADDTRPKPPDARSAQPAPGRTAWNFR